MFAITLLVVCMLLSSIFYLLIPWKLPWFYAMMIPAGGMMAMGVLLLTMQKAIEKVRKLFSHINLGLILWFNLFIISVWLFRYRDSIQLQQNPVDAAALIRIMSVAITGIVVFGMGVSSRKDIIGKLWHGLPGFMFAYGLVGLASAIYSLYWELSIYKSCELIVDLGMIAFFISCYPSQTDMKRWADFTWFMVALLIASVWIGAMISPSRAFHPVSAYQETVERAAFPMQIAGLMPPMNPNGLGFMSAVLTIISLSRTLHTRGKERLMYIMILATGLVTLVLTQARTSFIGGVLAIVTTLLFSRRIKVIAFMIPILALLVIFTGMPSLLLKYVLRGQTPEQARELSGRRSWWIAGLEDFLGSPIYGYGLGAGVRYVTFSKIGHVTGSSIHSSWMEILINTGLMGTIPVALAFIGTWWTLLLINLRPPTWLSTTMRMLSVEMMALWVLMSVRLTFGGCSFYHDREMMLFFLVVAYAQQVRNWRKAEERQEINKIVGASEGLIEE